MTSAEKEIREIILHNFIENPTWTYKKLAKFVGASVSTVQRAIKRYREDLSVERKVGSGRKKGPVNKKAAAKVRGTIKRSPNMSVRDVASKVGVSKSFVQRTKKEAHLKTFKVQKMPDRDSDKEKVARTRARKLYDDFITKYPCCIMDDETYIKADFSQLPGQEFYTGRSQREVQKKFRCRKTSKFPKKYLIWQAICSCGLKSETFVTSGTVNQEVYISECLQQRLLPFILSHNVPVFFWPDLATSHYSNKAKEWYTKNNVTYVPKEANPPNCPELRPIERYWAIVKQQLKKTKGKCKSEKELLKKWKKSAEKVTSTIVQVMMGQVSFKVRNFWRNGEI